MKRGIVRRILILIFSGLLCLGMVFYNKKTEEVLPESTGSLTLWYAEPDLSPTLMNALLTRCREESGIFVSAERFADEQALAEAFETGRPDLLFCSHIRAAQINEGEGLAAIAEALPYSETLTEAEPLVGTSFFPIGMRLQLLVTNTTLTNAQFDSLESLLLAARETPFITSDEWSMLLYTSMSAEGRQMQGIPEKDRENKRYVALYNLLAEAYFRGGLVVTEENAAEYVRQGVLPCAIVRSTAPAGMEDAELAFQPVPLPDGAKERYPAELMGFALLQGADTETSERFAQWLRNSQGTQEALSAGLVPITRGDAGTETAGALGKFLLSFAGREALFLPDAEEPFFENRAACELSLRKALDLLA